MACVILLLASLAARPALLLLLPLLLAGDSAEIQRWRSCHTGAGVPQRNEGCRDTDIDRDGDTDSDDFGLWQRRWYVPASQPATQPAATQPCSCPCGEIGGVDIRWQVYRRGGLPADLQAEFDTFNQQFGSKLATRPE